MTATLIVGGARSGKSRLAEARAVSTSDRRTYIATAEAGDEEMADRIARHRKQRDGLWKTVECPLNLSDAILDHSSNGALVLVDCLTLWLSNIIHAGLNVDEPIQELLGAITTAPGDLVFVSNEVGMGLVPNSPLGREFRDHQGRLNQSVASVCQRVEFIAAGLPLVLKNEDN